MMTPERPPSNRGESQDPGFGGGFVNALQVDRDPFRIFESRTKLVDSVVASAVSNLLRPKLQGDFVVAAVGGYGRRELFPHSDIDLLLLFENETDLPGIREPLSEFLRSLWDAGLRVSHSVHTVADCCRPQEQNVELHISLLDLRFLCGSDELFGSFTQQLPEFYLRYGMRLMSRLGELARHRHSKFNNTVYHLEPNIKETPGGIRDVHLLRWLSQLAPQYEALQSFCKAFEDTPGFLYAIRCFLHIQAGRDNNLLTFELQDEAARSLPEHPIAPAEWMRLYFQHARRVFQSSLRALEYGEAQDTSLLRHFRDWRTRLSTSDFTISRERVLLRNPASILRSAESVLSLFTFAARHGVQLSWDAERRIRAAVNPLKLSFAEHPPSATVWRELFSQPHTALALREMQETGLLAAAIPEWHNIDSLVVPDFYHRYTVDEHTLVAIEAIDRLTASQSGTLLRFHELLVEEEDPSQLRFSLLLHDLGKGTHPGNHIEGSLEAARTIMRRLGLPKLTQETILFLIEHHLDLSLIMNGRDLDDPATARYLTSRVGTEERLRSLTLLTYADISAVNPTAMTPWRLEQLWRVYSMGLEQLSHELATDRVHSAASLASEKPVSTELARFIEGLPTRYLRTHTREEIERHLALHKIAELNGVAVEIDHRGGAYLMTVLTRDRPGLFASLCGALASFGMNIVKAEASSNAADSILDLIRFTDPVRTLELNPSEIERLQQTVERVVNGTIAVADLLKRRRAAPRPSSEAKIPPVVRFDNQASDTSTLIDFVGEDRPGLLYDLASALSHAGCNIDVLMIDTQAHKAIDVFYVTREGEKLKEAAQNSLHFDLIRAATQ
ncbi:MAG: HD domain-containing protein [Bryobacteraceae bacterium]